MTNIVQIQDRLKSVPDKVLLGEMQKPTGQAPQFLVLNELNRRKNDRAEYARRQQEGPQTTVAEDVVRPAAPPMRPPMGQAGPAMPPPQAMGALQAMPPQQPMPQQPPMRPQPVQMNEGGLLSLPKFQEGGGYNMLAELASLSQKWTKTPAEIARQKMLTESLASARGSRSELDLPATVGQPSFLSSALSKAKSHLPDFDMGTLAEHRQGQHGDFNVNLLAKQRERRRRKGVDMVPGPGSAELMAGPPSSTRTFMPELRQITQPVPSAVNVAGFKSNRVRVPRPDDPSIHLIPTGAVNKDAAATNYANRVLSDVGRYNKDVRVHGRSTPFLPIEGNQVAAVPPNQTSTSLNPPRNVGLISAINKGRAFPSIITDQSEAVRKAVQGTTVPADKFADMLARRAMGDLLATDDAEVVLNAQNMANALLDDVAVVDADAEAAELNAQKYAGVIPKDADELGAELELAQAKANKRIPSVLQSNAVQRVVDAIPKEVNLKAVHKSGGPANPSKPPIRRWIKPKRLAPQTPLVPVVPASFPGDNNVRLTSAAFTEPAASNGNGQVPGGIVDVASSGPQLLGESLDLSAETIVDPNILPRGKSAIEKEQDKLIAQLNSKKTAPTLEAGKRISDLKKRADNIDKERGSTAARRMFEAGLNIMAEAGKPGASFGGTIPSILRAVGTGAAPAVSAYGKDIAALEARKDALQSKVVDAQLRGDANAIQKHANDLKAIIDRLSVLQKDRQIELEAERTAATVSQAETARRRQASQDKYQTGQLNVSKESNQIQARRERNEKLRLLIGDSEAQKRSSFLAGLYKGEEDKGIRKETLDLGGGKTKDIYHIKSGEAGQKAMNAYSQHLIKSSPNTLPALERALTSSQKAVNEQAIKLETLELKWEKQKKAPLARAKNKIDKLLKKENSALLQKKPADMSEDDYKLQLLEEELIRTNSVFRNLRKLQEANRVERGRVGRFRGMIDQFSGGAGGAKKGEATKVVRDSSGRLVVE